jgi:hypothetical protein
MHCLPHEPPYPNASMFDEPRLKFAVSDATRELVVTEANDAPTPRPARFSNLP